MQLRYNFENSIFKFNTKSNLILGTAGKKFNDIDYSKDINTVKKEEISRLDNLLGIGKDSIIMLNQVHGDSIIDSDSLKIIQSTQADGIITGTDKTCLVIRTADCVPVYAFDREKNVLGAVHSGWKGCRLNIAGSLIKKMKSDYKSNIKDILAYILPSIGPESYTIKMDVGKYFKSYILENNHNIYLNLWKNIYDSLIDEDIPVKNIFQSEICTFKNNSDFFSYRQGDSGRNLNFAFISN